MQLPAFQARVACPLGCCAEAHRGLSWLLSGAVEDLMSASAQVPALPAAQHADVPVPDLYSNSVQGQAVGLQQAQAGACGAAGRSRLGRT